MDPSGAPYSIFDYALKGDFILIEYQNKTCPNK